MASESKSRLDKAREAATGLKRVELANVVGGTTSEQSSAAFVKPVFLQEPDYKDVKGALFVYDKAGNQLIDPFYNLIISASKYAMSDRVSRTATMDGEYRKFLGKAPVRVAFTIGLFDYKNHPWKDQFVFLWNEVFRGTVLQDYNASVYVYCGGDIFIGDAHACDVSKAGEQDGVVIASLQMDCNREPIPFNPAFTASEIEDAPAIQNSILKTIQSGVRVSKVVFD